VAGDERDPEIARLAAETGATVTAFGIRGRRRAFLGVQLVDSAAAAVDGANYLFFPIPLGVGAVLYAPHVSEPLLANEALFSKAAPDAWMFCGRIRDEVQAAADAAGVCVHEYDPDRELMLLRGPAIVEGALQQAIEATDVTINDAEVVVIGFGNIGQLLARTLRGLGARVHVAARNPDPAGGGVRRRPVSAPARGAPRPRPSLDMVFSTVPAPVVDRPFLERLPTGTLVLDIAPPPDHADLDAAAELGHRAVWARGLGKRAPITVGRSQWAGLRRFITEIELAKREGRTWQ
jgi:dipicolinate synthase subunit A